MTTKKTYIAIDGGLLRKAFRMGGLAFSADNVDKLARHCVGKNEELLKILFYDCLPYQPEKGKDILNPVSREPLPSQSRRVFADLEQKNLFALRFGTLAFRGWRFRIGGDRDNKDDYTPIFQQKGVDMRIGLDMASIAERRLVDRLVLISSDTDLIPAMKICRRNGIQVVIVKLPPTPLPPPLLAHADILREKQWCKGLTPDSQK